MKKQINPTIKAHVLRSGFYVILLSAVCVIPFALGQRDTTGRNFAKRVSPSVSSVPGWVSPALSSWSIVANYPAVIQSPAVSTDGTYAYSGGGSDNLVPIDGFYRYAPVADMWTDELAAWRFHQLSGERGRGWQQYCLRRRKRALHHHGS